MKRNINEFKNLSIEKTQNGINGQVKPVRFIEKRKEVIMNYSVLLVFILPFFTIGTELIHSTTTEYIETLNATTAICTEGTTAVVLIVDMQLVTQIRSNLNQFEEDLCNENYAIFEKISDFTTPVEVRNYLYNLYEQTDHKLEGVIFIGKIPWAYQWYVTTFTNPDIPPSEKEVISFQFYSDLDGSFAASQDYVSPGNQLFSFDQHDGDMNWEIWASILPFYKDSLSLTADAINLYFEKNHSYRIGEYDLHRCFLLIQELLTATTLEEHNRILDQSISGQYSWTPFSNAEDALIYFNSPVDSMSVDLGIEDLSQGVANFTVHYAHGLAYGSGSLSIVWVESNNVNTVFFWDSGCSVGNLDAAENFITSLVYSPTSSVLVAKGATARMGGMGTNQDGFFGHNIATQLALGNNFGKAILNHVNVPLIWPWSLNREGHFAPLIFIGDPTLKLRPFADFTAYTKAFTVRFSDNSIGFISDWHWDFGDGQTSTEQNPIYTYESADTFNVSLTVVGHSYSDTKTREDYIIITNPNFITEQTSDNLKSFMLFQNFPNPFNQTTTIDFTLPYESNLDLSIYNVSGRLVETLINENRMAGYYSVKWDASELPSGVYVYKIKTNSYSEVRKCLLIK